MNKTNNQETVSKLKKTYSTLAQATNQIIAEEGPVITWVTSADNIYNLYKKKLKNAEECGLESGCFPQDIFTLNGHEEYWNNLSNQHRLVLQDGTQIMFTSYFDSTCMISNTNNDGSTNYCQRIFVDVNGARKPNTYGKDIYAFVLKKQGLYPAGCDINNLCSKEYNGTACACKVLREGAINY